VPDGLLVDTRYPTLVALTEQVNIVAAERGAEASLVVTSASTQEGVCEYVYWCAYRDCEFTVRSVQTQDGVVICRENAHTCINSTSIVSKPIYPELIGQPPAAVPRPKRYERFVSLDDVIRRASLARTLVEGRAKVVKLEPPETDSDGRMSGGNLVIKCTKADCRFHVYATTTTTWSPNFALVESSDPHMCAMKTEFNLILIVSLLACLGALLLGTLYVGRGYILTGYLFLIPSLLFSPVLVAVARMSEPPVDKRSDVLDAGRTAS